MSRFASKKLQEIDLGEGEFVKIPVALSYEQVMRFTRGGDEVETSKEMLKECIKEWNLKDEDGNIPEINEKTILSLDIQTITTLSQEITKLLMNSNQDKKK